jgi:competence protein ComGF
MLIEIKQGENIRVIDSGRGIEYENQLGQTIRYEKYQHMLRKRVDRKGHVLVLQNIEDVSFSIEQGQVNMKARSMNQQEYEAFFPVYQLFEGGKQ